jgi:hypothetical protein
MKGGRGRIGNNGGKEMRMRKENRKNDLKNRRERRV